MFRLDGQRAIVTGASRGIGAALAIGLLRAGASVLLVSRKPPADPVLAELTATGGTFHHFSADLGRVDSVAGVLAAARERLGGVDILVNNAGQLRRGPLLEHTEADWDAVLGLNLKVPFFLAQACAREMVAAGRGKIINICSIQSFLGGVMASSYTASKHALLGLTRAMANELGARGVNVNGVAPGFIRTEMTPFLDADKAYADWLLTRIPAKRFGEPEDVVGAVLFLASAASDYMNGQLVVVDGGMLGR